MCRGNKNKKKYLSSKLGTIPVGWSGTKVLGCGCVYLLRVSSHAMSVFFFLVGAIRVKGKPIIKVNGNFISFVCWSFFLVGYVR